jgi:hypothetical protein
VWNCEAGHTVLLVSLFRRRGATAQLATVELCGTVWNCVELCGTQRRTVLLVSLFRRRGLLQRRSASQRSILRSAGQWAH